MRHLHFLLELLLARFYLDHSPLELALADKEPFVEGCLRQDNLGQVPSESFCLISIQAYNVNNTMRQHPSQGREITNALLYMQSYTSPWALQI